jgi:DNA repair exonuclease SbcCD nuclease subunit
VRIGVISDLHVDLNGGAAGPETFSRHLASAARRHGAELLLIAGDLADRYDVTLRALEEIQAQTGLRLCVLQRLRQTIPARVQLRAP